MWYYNVAVAREILGEFAVWMPDYIGAGDGPRTRDPDLGKVVLYQLSYTRKTNNVKQFTTTKKNVKVLFAAPLK